MKAILERIIAAMEKDRDTHGALHRTYDPKAECPEADFWIERKAEEDIRIVRNELDKLNKGEKKTDG